MLKWLLRTRCFLKLAVPKRIRYYGQLSPLTVEYVQAIFIYVLNSQRYAYCFTSRVEDRRPSKQALVKRQSHTHAQHASHGASDVDF